MTAVALDVLLDQEDLDQMLRRDVARGLCATPKELPPKWFYDDRGCKLFDAITELPEYYASRSETEILRARAARIAEATCARSLIELGSGSSQKTRILLDALTASGKLQQYVSFDIAEPYLRVASEHVAAEYPIEVSGIVGDFEHHAGSLPDGPNRLIVFLGSTIGNLYPADRARFFATIARQMSATDHFLLGADLVKDRRRLEAAYNDGAGVTAAFNLNLLAVLNRQLDGDFDLDAFEHRAFFDAEHSWIEMRLRSKRRQRVTLDAVSISASFEEGEEMRTEISQKFTRPTLTAELARAGLHETAWWTDTRGDYSLSLWSRRPGPDAVLSGT
ncbi:MAG: L-histidine N(alpha)-methyltransferase [Actinomycetota bacterium]